MITAHGSVTQVRPELDESEVGVIGATTLVLAIEYFDSRSLTIKSLFLILLNLTTLTAVPKFLPSPSWHLVLDSFKNYTTRSSIPLTCFLFPLFHMKHAVAAPVLPTPIHRVRWRGGNV